MLYCSWCDNQFYDGETHIIRLACQQEIPMHAECFAAWCANERELIKVFGAGDGTESVQWWERTFRDSQIEATRSEMSIR